MKKVDLTLPEFGFVVVTRGGLGAGIGLLAGGRQDARGGPWADVVSPSGR